MKLMNILKSLVAVTVMSISVAAQSSGGGFTIQQSVVASGGGASTDTVNNAFSVTGTIGQSAAGMLTQGGPYSQIAGFWNQQSAVVPTAADGTISGIVATSDGSPLGGVVVVLGGAKSGKAITNALGVYEFADLDPGGFYIVTPARANYSFSPGNHAISLFGHRVDAFFVALTANSGNSANPLDTPEFFARQHYLDFLGREPDAAGFNFWSDQMLECGSDLACLERRRINVSAAYFLSIEFQQTGGLVDGLYRASFGRRPLYAEFAPDASAIGAELIVGRNGWQQQLERNKQAFIEAWVQRPAFFAAYSNLSNDEYVAQLIAHTKVSYSIAQRDNLVAGLGNATLTRSAVLRRIVEDQRFISARRNETFVMMQYFGYLRRDPDPAGYQFWLNKLNEFDGDFERAEMVKAFLNSAEYRSRFH